MSTDELEIGTSVSVSDEVGEPEGEGDVEKPKRRLDIGVNITDVGPCKKHLKITIPREEIDRGASERGGCPRVSRRPRSAATGRQAIQEAGVRPGQIESADVFARAD
jgi:hypothetical protein